MSKILDTDAVSRIIDVVSRMFDTLNYRSRSPVYIAWRAEHNSSWVAGLGMLLAVNCLALGVDNVWTANLLVLSLALSELLGYVLRIRYYRKGM